MFDSKTKYRIVNKSSKGVKLSVGGQSLELDWNSFNSQFTITDKFYAILKPEFAEKMNKVDDLIDQALICILYQNGNGDAIQKMSHLAALADITKEISKQLNCTSFEATALIRQRIELFRNDPFGAAFGLKPEKKTVERPKEKEPQPTPVYEEKKPTFGDAFSCLNDLKEKMKS